MVTFLQEEFLNLPNNAVDGDLVAATLDAPGTVVGSEEGAQAAQLLHELSLQFHDTS